MATGLTKRDIDIWHRKGNNWRKEGKRVKKGTRLTGNINGDYFYPTPDTRTKKAWIAFDTVVVDPPEDPKPPTGESKVWYYVKHQWTRIDADEYHGRIGLPLVFRMGEYDNPKNAFEIRLNEKLQLFWADLLAKVVYNKRYSQLDKTQKRYIALRTSALMTGALAFCNKHGVDKYKNYLTGENDKADDPTMYTLVCDGASLQGVKVESMLKVDHFDPDNLPADVDPYTDPRVFFATTGRDYHVNRFPQLDGLDVPVPIFSREDLYFRLIDLERYEGTAKRKPYYP